MQAFNFEEFITSQRDKRLWQRWREREEREGDGKGGEKEKKK